MFASILDEGLNQPSNRDNEEVFQHLYIKVQTINMNSLFLVIRLG